MTSPPPNRAPVKEDMMTSSPVSSGISHLHSIEKEYAAPAVVARNCQQQDWAGECRRSLEDPAGFWEEYALRFKWTQPWVKAMSFDGVHHQWFVGGKTNITLNALD